ncbi:MAG: cytochrome, partial [Solirubrobacterales bacterium]|nr:cytochrome [Solirubrobacterales bacterium]
MSLAGPQPVSSNPVLRLAADLRAERAATVPFPPGKDGFSMARTRGMLVDPLTLLLGAYAEHGPVFTLRIFHGRTVFMIGPAANHHMLVSHAKDFSWREGHMGDLIPLLGDGLLTIDGEFHRRSRKVMLPAFHHERIAAMSELMTDEIDAAVGAWRPGQQLDLYGWTRHLAMRIAMRALFGMDGARDAHSAALFEVALGFWGQPYIRQIMRGPFTPWARMQRARRELDQVIYAEIDRRRASGERGEDILSLLIDASDEEGRTLSKQHIRDEVMTLLFAGHDTTTSTVTFLFHELAGAPAWADRAAGDDAALEQCLDEALRRYPPAWIGPRKAMVDYEFEGRTVPAGAFVNYSSWVSHHLPDVWDEPFAFRPERFAEGGEVSRLPKGAYVPFGGGSRTCIGMRFGQQEIRLMARRILRDFRLELPAGHELRVRQTP